MEPLIKSDIKQVGFQIHILVYLYSFPKSLKNPSTLLSITLFHHNVQIFKHNITIPPKTTKRTTISHFKSLNTYRPRNMVLKIQAWLTGQAQKCDVVKPVDAVTGNSSFDVIEIVSDIGIN